MAICVGYFEENDAVPPGRLTVSGLVSQKVRWQALEERWPRVLRGEDVTAFSGRDFIRGAGEFSTGWLDDPDRQTRLIATLTQMTRQHVLRGMSCSIDLRDYQAIDQKYRFTESVSGPYGVCAACVIGRIQGWMARHRPDDLTLFVFEEGELDHREIRRLLRAEGIERGEPAQVWPRQWTDERGRQRLLRPFEACDLLIPGCKSPLIDQLSERAAWEHEVIDRDHLEWICKALSVAERSRLDAGEAVRRRQRTISRPA